MLVKAVPIKQMSIGNKLRYCIVDVKSHKILCDGTRHTGFKSKQAAYNFARHWYGCKVHIYDAEFCDNPYVFWLHKHPYIEETISTYAYLAQLPDLPNKIMLDETTIQSIIDFYEVNDEITSSQLLYLWCRRNK